VLRVIIAREPGELPNDGAGFGVVKSEHELCDFLRISVEIIGEQDFLIGRPNVVDGHGAGRIDFQDLCAPHREGSLLRDVTGRK
jgi:hypothetical protein